jgi:putative Mn2+ efflux pump MntP
MLLETPEQQRRLIEYFRRDAAYYIAFVIVLVLGIYLVRAGFTS